MKQIKRDSSKPKELRLETKQRRIRKTYTQIMLKLNENCCVLHFKISSQMDHKNSK